MTKSHMPQFMGHHAGHFFCSDLPIGELAIKPPGDLDFTIGCGQTVARINFIKMAANSRHLKRFGHAVG